MFIFVGLLELELELGWCYYCEEFVNNWNNVCKRRFDIL